jgi:predicted nucleotidyltransferase component of viral defense system
MISQESIQKLARQYHVPEHPNIVREYFQHLFLSELYKLDHADHLLFKGGTALRIVYNSPRFSEDLDFTISGIASHLHREFVERLFTTVLASIEHSGVIVTLGAKPGTTSGGYYGDATFKIFDYEPVVVAINISSRGARGASQTGMKPVGEVDTIASDFIPPYSIFHLSQEELVSEKIFGALLDRGKVRDFYDLYFIMRHGMLTSGQKKELAKVKDKILKMANKLDFQSELAVFLPSDQQNIIRDFGKMLAAELNRQLSGSFL